METTLNQSHSTNPSDQKDLGNTDTLKHAQSPDEFNILEYIYILVKNKWWIIGATMLGLIAGYLFAIVKGPLYTAEAVIAAKEADNSPVPNLSGLGMLGGMVTSQLNISYSPGLDKIDLILDSKKFNAELIKKYDLLPMIYKYSWPKDFKKYFDSTKNAWDISFQPPNLLNVGSFIKNKYIKREIKSSVMTITITTKDSTFTDTLISKYLDYLNNYIKTTVQAEAKENVMYLENQLITVADPFIREKLQNKIATEMEKLMLVSKEAYRLIDPPLREIQYNNKKIYPVVFGSGLFFLSTMVILIFHALFSSNMNDFDIELMKKIKMELFLPLTGTGKRTKF